MPSYGAGTKNACLVGSHNSPRRKLVVPHRVRRVLVSLLYCGMLNNVRRVEWASLQRSLPSLANESFTTTSPWRSTRKKMARTLGAQTGIMVRKQQKNTTTPFSHLSIPWSLPFILSLSLSLHCCGLPIGKCCRRLGSPALRAVGLIGFATTELPLRLAGARPCCTNLGFLPATQRYVLLRDPTSMQVQARKDSRALGD
jgi:hypothetical protein